MNAKPKKSHPWRTQPVSPPKTNPERVIPFHAQMGLRATR
jgi:hypothetical protein